MEVDSTDSLIPGATGSCDCATPPPGATPDAASPAKQDSADATAHGDANQESPGIHGSPAGAESTGPSADTELHFTLKDVIREFVEPCFIPDRWKFLSGDDRRQRIDMAPAQFADEMLAYFTPEYLVAEGLFEQVGDEVRLAEPFNGAAELLVEVDASSGGVIFTAGETQVPAGHTALACAQLRRSDTSADPTRNLYVTASVEEIEIFRWLDLPAVSCDGLETVCKPEIDALFAGDHRSDTDWQYNLILVDFDLAGFRNRPVAGVGDIVQRLVNAAGAYHIDPTRRFTVLRPTANEFLLLEHAVDFADSARSRALLEAWADAAKRARADRWLTHDRREVPTYAAARKTLQEQLDRKTLDPLGMREALEAYRATGMDPIMRKFYAQIELQSNPFTRSKLHCAAQLSEICFELDPMERAAKAVVAGQAPPSGSEWNDEELTRLLRCSAELRRIERELSPRR